MTDTLHRYIAAEIRLNFSASHRHYDLISQVSTDMQSLKSRHVNK